VGECSFDCQEVSGFAALGVILDYGVSSCETASPCRTDGIFREHLGQRIGEFEIKRRNISSAHDPTPVQVARSILKLASARSPNFLQIGTKLSTAAPNTFRVPSMAMA
jgi:hypothetical protein